MAGVLKAIDVSGLEVEDTVKLLAAGLEFPLSLQGQVSIGDRVQEIEIERIEEFKRNILLNGKLSEEEIDKISMEAMQAKLQQADQQADMKSALVYLTVRERDGVEGVEVIMVPGDPIQEPIHRFVKVSFRDLEDNYSDFFKYVKKANKGSVRSTEYISPGKLLYDTLISEIDDDLRTLGIDHLQIIPDASHKVVGTERRYTGSGASSHNVLISLLQNIPYGALVNPDTGKHLIGEFSLAIAPSFHLTEPQYQDMRNAEGFILAESEFEDSNKWSKLPYVIQEFNTINHSNETKIPENNRFNANNLENVLNSLNINPQFLHIATHGQYWRNSDSRDDYLATYKPEDYLSLYKLLNTYNFDSLELAVFSACQAAIGNAYLEYGLAGATWLKGAESVIGTLWDVADEETAIIMDKLHTIRATQDIPVAKILQAAQIEMINYPNPFPNFSDSYNLRKHPYYWSAFQLIGSGH
ncbi:CHAT domain-containing protein [Spirulina sp. 06S082]|uniref:CHAT domain-containing protein n=1 Tax=Spirulina sp. 06S082 TaxID=3110248 RepID=UPI002B1EF63F|nr:CHAT domain-containing protein [Spirulina sp. 06S082]MEA5469097.1 CHAT domain-containing protein [Spirulina sp. 06S082]